MIEWMVAGCGGGLVAAKGVGGATKITYLRVSSPKAENLRVLLKILLSCLFWFPKRFRVRDVAKVLVERLREKV
jgi:hypothetical protein